MDFDMNFAGICLLVLQWNRIFWNCNPKILWATVHLDLLMGIDLELRSMALDPLRRWRSKWSAGSNASISPFGPSSASLPIFVYD